MRACQARLGVHSGQRSAYAMRAQRGMPRQVINGTAVAPTPSCILPLRVLRNPDVTKGAALSEADASGTCWAP